MHDLCCRNACILMNTCHAGNHRTHGFCCRNAYTPTKTCREDNHPKRALCCRSAYILLMKKVPYDFPTQSFEMMAWCRCFRVSEEEFHAKPAS